MRKLDQLKNIYRQNEDGAYIIEVFLDRYIHAFNEWDSAYLEVRDLSPGLIHFLERCSHDIPFKYDIEILFTVAEEETIETEKLIIRGVKSYFSYKILKEKENLTNMIRKILKYFGISVFFLIMSFSLEPILPDTLMGNTAREGLMIGGWVFLWQAISLFAFNVSEIKQKINEYKRFLKANIKFRYDPE
ncbi:hypothetical protein [Natranaerobius trueperi]|uniref:Uncharacterized protein n=1 Tax=Natranaerobius trueperi TaxID=759412 RepID=A0A226C028_9FIRM|nr:hypothetical protein [Natranaerobius trueperi]OWZ84623.1 hypothetical protein CDO51_02360 [Natranaerobius trueperi]